MRIEQKYNNRGGCLRMAVILILAAALLSMASCTVTKKDGCGTENYKKPFNK